MIPLAIAAVVMVAALLFYMWWSQERLAYQPQGPPYPDVSSLRRVDYSARDGQPLLGFLVGEPATARGVLVAFHGNADMAGWQSDWGRQIARETGYAVLLAEYRGYMGLPGRPTYAGTRLDALAAYEFVRDSLGVQPADVALFGHSLGAAIATELARQHRPQAVLLQAPFTSSRAIVEQMFARPAGYLWTLVSRVPYDTHQTVTEVDAPVSVIHGARDGIIPVAMGRAVHEAAKVKGELVVIDDAGHNDLTIVAGDRYWRWIARALDSARAETPLVTAGTTRVAPSPTR